MRLTYEMVRAAAELIVPRTVTTRPAPQVVVLGTGLDGRPWPGREVFEVDQPAPQRAKRGRAVLPCRAAQVALP